LDALLSAIAVPHPDDLFFLFVPSHLAVGGQETGSDGLPYMLWIATRPVWFSNTPSEIDPEISNPDHSIFIL
jgi:hypothetical protein